MHFQDCRQTESAKHLHDEAPLLDINLNIFKVMYDVEAKQTENNHTTTVPGKSLWPFLLEFSALTD